MSFPLLPLSSTLTTPRVPMDFSGDDDDLTWQELADAVDGCLGDVPSDFFETVFGNAGEEEGDNCEENFECEELSDHEENDISRDKSSVDVDPTMKRTRERIEFEEACALEGVWHKRMAYCCVHGSVLGMCPLCNSCKGMVKTRMEGVDLLNSFHRVDSVSQANSHYTTQRVLILDKIRVALNELSPSSFSKAKCVNIEYNRCISYDSYGRGQSLSSTVAVLEMHPRQDGLKPWEIYIILDYESLYTPIDGDRPAWICWERVRHVLRLEKSVELHGNGLIWLSDSMMPHEIPNVVPSICKLADLFAVCGMYTPCIGAIYCNDLISKRIELSKQSVARQAESDAVKGTLHRGKIFHAYVQQHSYSRYREYPSMISSLVSPELGYFRRTAPFEI